jgi:hypothetical protein
MQPLPVPIIIAVVVTIAVIVSISVLTRPVWQHFIFRNWRPLLFSALCLFVPAAFVQFVKLYAGYGDLDFHAATNSWLLFGGFAACLLSGWSAWDFREHKGRALIGFLVCAAAFWWTFASVREIAQFQRGLPWDFLRAC